MTFITNIDPIIHSINGFTDITVSSTSDHSLIHLQQIKCITIDIMITFSEFSRNGAGATQRMYGSLFVYPIIFANRSREPHSASLYLEQAIYNRESLDLTFTNTHSGRVAKGTFGIMSLTSPSDDPADEFQLICEGEYIDNEIDKIGFKTWFDQVITPDAH